MILSAKAKIAGIMGWPVGHSLSPRLHGFWLDHYRIDGTYIPYAVEPHNALEAIRMLPKLGFAGTNVTLPHKETALRAVDEADATARAIGAVNTVIVRPDGSLFGTNTDCFGFIEGLRSHAPDWTAKRGPAVVFGAGGSSRAICHALTQDGAPEIKLINRTLERAKDLADTLDGPIVPVAWKDREAALEDAAILVNTTSQGMSGNPKLDLSLDRLPTDALVSDIVYTPLETPLLADARERGNRTVDGLEMLLHQARPGFAAWFGVEPTVTEDLRQFVLQALGS